MSYILQTSHLSKTIGGKQLVTDVNIHVKKGEVYGFLGPNGAGKTTVMKMLTNLWKPTGGTAWLFGNVLEKNSYEVLKRMGSIIEFPTFYDHIILDEPTNGLDPAGMKQIRDLFRMLCTEYGMTLMISSHLLPEIENIADTVGVIHHGKMMKEISMKEIAETNTAYIALAVEDTKKAAYVLAEKMQLSNFKIVNDSGIRIYEKGVTTQKISRELMANDVEIASISQHAENLEDYFLKITSEVGKSC